MSTIVVGLCAFILLKQNPNYNEMRPEGRRGARDLLSKANEVLMVRVHVGQLNVYQKHDL